MKELLQQFEFILFLSIMSVGLLVFIRLMYERYGKVIARIQWKRIFTIISLGLMVAFFFSSCAKVESKPVKPLHWTEYSEITDNRSGHFQHGEAMIPYTKQLEVHVVRVKTDSVLLRLDSIVVERASYMWSEINMADIHSVDTVHVTKYRRR